MNKAHAGRKPRVDKDRSGPSFMRSEIKVNTRTRDGLAYLHDRITLLYGQQHLVDQ